MFCIVFKKNLFSYHGFKLHGEWSSTIWWAGGAVMSAPFLCQVGQCLGVDGFIEEREAGGAEEAVALSILFSHEHVVQACMGKSQRGQ